VAEREEGENVNESAHTIKFFLPRVLDAELNNPNRQN
jgi:hypothetical protein